MNDILDTIRKQQEAYKLLHKIPTERQFSDREIGPYVAELEQIEIEIYSERMNAENDQQSRQHEDTL